MSRQKEHMSRTWTKRMKIIGALAGVLAAAAVIPSAGVAASTSSERTTFKSCGHLPFNPNGGYFPVKVEVLEGNVPCRVALRVMKDQYSNDPRIKGDKGWSCDGAEGFHVCKKTRGRHQGTIRARFGCEPRTEGPRAALSEHRQCRKVVQRRA
jgi:hypothetical protein